MSDALTWRCRQKLSGYGSPCSDRATFWVYPDGHPADGIGACTQHLGKAVRALLAADTSLTEACVGDISRMEKAA